MNYPRGICIFRRYHRTIVEIIVARDQSQFQMNKNWVKSLFLLLLSLIAAGAQSQFSFGFKAGINLSRITSKGDTTGSEKYFYDLAPSLHIGATGSIKVSDRISVCADLLLSEKGYRKDSDGILEASRLLYSNMPVYLNLKLSDHFSLHAGPELGILIATRGDDRKYTNSLYSKVDLGAIAGVAYDISRRLSISLRLEQGISNIVSKNAHRLERVVAPTSDPVIVSRNLRDSGFVRRNQNVQLSMTWSLWDRLD